MIAFVHLYVGQLKNSYSEESWYWIGRLRHSGETVEIQNESFFLTEDDARVNAAKWAAWLGAEMEGKNGNT